MRRRFSISSVIVLFGVGACGGGKDTVDPPPPPPPVGSVAISLSAASIDVTQGDSGTATVTVTRSGSFTGDVSLSASPVVGLTVSFSPEVVPSGATTATVTVVVASNVNAGGSLGFQITAQATGVSNAIAVLQVRVQQRPFVQLVLDSAVHVFVEPGGSQTLVGAVLSPGVTGPITYALSGGPPGTRLDTLARGSFQKEFTISVPVGAAAGTYSLTLTMTPVGPAAVSATVPMTVTAPSTGNVVFRFCGDAQFDLPLFVAARDGQGAWNRVPIGSNGGYRFSITQSGSVAWVTRFVNGFRTQVVHASATELQSRGQNHCWTPISRLVTYSTTLPATTLNTFVEFGGRAPIVDGDGRIYGAPDGPQDLLAVLQTVPDVTSRILLRRGVSLSGNTASLGPIAPTTDPDAFDPVTRQITVAGSTTGVPIAVSGFSATTFPIDSVDWNLSFRVGTQNTNAVQIVPPARTRLGDLHVIGGAFADVNAQSIITEYRLVEAFRRDPVDTTLTVGPVLNPVAVTFPRSAAGDVLARATWPQQFAYPSEWRASFDQLSGVPASLDRRTVGIIASAAYLGGGNVDLAVPDLSALPGWRRAWGIQPGRPVEWQANALRFDLFTPTGRLVAGSARTMAARLGTVTP